MVDHYGSVNCDAAQIVERQLSFNTDPGVPAMIPGAEGKFVTQWLMVLEPEQLRYAANLYISYTDLSRPDDQFAFLPALRRYQPISTLARCSPSHDTDSTPEELREDEKKRDAAFGSFFGAMVEDLSRKNRENGGDGNVTGIVVG